MGSVDHDLCRKMDELAVKHLELMDDILLCRNRLENVLKDGFIDMAKARYSMGNHAVSVVQLPTEDSDVEAKRRVCTKTVSGNKTVFTEFSLELVSHAACEPYQKNHEENVLRKRNVEDSSEIKKDEYQMEEVVKENGVDKNRMKRKDLRFKDPLLWFGVLVPANLKESQKSFEKAVSVMCELATLQSELQSVSCEFFKLQKQKFAARKNCDIDNLQNTNQKLE